MSSKWMHSLGYPLETIYLNALPRLPTSNHGLCCIVEVYHGIHRHHVNFTYFVDVRTLSTTTSAATHIFVCRPLVP